MSLLLHVAIDMLRGTQRRAGDKTRLDKMLVEMAPLKAESTRLMMRQLTYEQHDPEEVEAAKIPLSK